MTRFIEITEEGLPADPIVGLLWEGLLTKSADTWDQREELWKTYYGVDPKTFRERAELNGFVQARNAITHGLGRLTRKQLRNRSQTTGRLSNAHIVVRGDVVVLAADHVERCAVVTKLYVAWLDAKTGS